MSHYVDSTEQLVVELSVRDLQRSLTLYRGLGFHVLREEKRFAVVAWEDHRLFLAQESDLPKAPATPVMNVRVMVPDVDRAWQRVNELGLRVVAPVGDRPYGLRDFTIADPDGFGVRFASWLRTEA
jgi:catechol 2,3-dioxygenase-like lactoylglutathione lyase family enzyme